MPRHPLAGPSRLPTCPLYWDSLDDLLSSSAASGTTTTTRNRAGVGASTVSDEDGDSNRPRLLVCHDFKGGYKDQEKEFEREHTFLWWELCDVFVYFSHHRVSPPPPSWVRTATRHSAKILGTLIFEWDAGRVDIVKLTLGASSASPRTESFSLVDTTYADILVDLCVERGFQGWLVNVEVPLGIDRPGGREKEGGKEHAEALIAWLEYLRRETKRRVPGGEIIWYDAVTTTGHLAWQNQLNHLNLPFFLSCDSIFNNYHYSPSTILSSTSLIDAQPTRNRKHVWWGIDVYGRGQYGGGGFESWRSLEAIQAAIERPLLLPPSTSGSNLSTAPPPPFSIALFAPGWTVESEHLGHDLTTPHGYRAWRADEEYLWAGGSPTPSVASEATRMLNLRKEERGVARAIALARSLSPSAPRLPLPPFDYHAPLPPLPGSFRPIAHYCPPRRPRRTTSFYTNWNSGSGFGFWVEGRKVGEWEKGWTDVDWCWPKASLASRKTGEEGWTVEREEGDAWMGGESLVLKVEERVLAKEGNVEIPLVGINIELRPRSTMQATIVWKARSPNFAFTPSPLVVSSSPEPLIESYTTSSTSSSTSPWIITTVFIKPPPAATTPLTLSELGVRLTAGTTSSSPSPNTASNKAEILIGSLSLIPVNSLPTPRITRLHLTTPSVSAPHSKLSWTVAYSLPPPTASLDAYNSPLPQPPPSSELEPSWPTFLFYTIWFLPSGISRSEAGESGNAVLLGTTVESEFWVDLGRVKEGMGGEGSLVVRGVGRDGGIEEWDGAMEVIV